MTKEGEKIAKKIFEKHKKLSEFFVEVLGADEEQAVEIACKMEHIVPDKIFKNMVKLTKYTKSNLQERIKNLY